MIFRPSRNSYMISAFDPNELARDFAGWVENNPNTHIKKITYKEHCTGQIIMMLYVEPTHKSNNHPVN